MAFERYVASIGMICGGNFTQVIWHFHVEDPTGNAWENADAFVEAFDGPVSGGSLATALTNVLAADDCFISSVRCRRVNPPGGAEAIKLFTPPTFPGAYPGHMEAAQVAGVVIWIPNTSDAASGRTFLPGVSEEAIDNGVFHEDYVAAVGALGDFLIDTGVLSTVGDFFLVLKRTKPTLTWPLITSGYLSPSPGTMRKRLVPY